jgi:hypothetical protein
LQVGAAGVLVATTVGVGGIMSTTAEGKTPIADNAQRLLIDALREIGGEVCLAAAGRLAASAPNSGITLALRRAGIDACGAQRLAEALTEGEGGQSQSQLTSLSLSYNTLGDIGTLAIAKALPQSIQALGLVDCGIGDPGGRALVAWASRASNLQMICVEGNAFSAEVRRDLKRLSGRNRGLLVVV